MTIYHHSRNIIIIILLTITISCSTISRQTIKQAIFSTPNLPRQLSLADPGQMGQRQVKTLLYASPYNPRREDYGIKNLAIISEPVDISPYFNNINHHHWGYTAESCPVNGKIWYAEGSDICPLVLCVHGNHDPYDESEFGYEYLGKHMASRGIIFASIDENFLNGIAGGEENDARAIILLEHIKQMLSWNRNPGNPLFRRIDENNIALIGHSRGGEAVVTAALFNSLDYYPDNANYKFDWHFSIKGIVSIAPVEGQYRPAERAISPADVNYLLIHGSHDGDVDIDMGLRFFNRSKPDSDMFRSAFWIFGANHAQFNTSWAKAQDPRPSWRSDLLTLSEQQKAAVTIISAFLEVSFGRQMNYLDFFKDYRTGIRWLPETIYISQYRDSTGSILANFEEDTRVETATLSGWHCRGDDFSRWAEGVLRYDFSIFEPIINADSSMIVNHINQENWCLVLEWISEDQPCFLLYTLENPAKAENLVFDLAVYNLIEKTQPFDLNIELVTAANKHFNFFLNDYFTLLEVPDSWILFKGYSQPMILQTIQIPLNRIPGWQTDSQISSIKFNFNKNNEGMLLMDNIILK